MPLEARFGPLQLIGGGFHSRVFVNDRDQIIKVYKHPHGLHRLEAENMRHAGLGDWVLEATNVAGYDVLVMRRFDGYPVTAQTLPQALPPLGAFLRRMHAAHQFEVNLDAVEEKLKRFSETLEPEYALLEPLFELVQRDLKRGVLKAKASFCHLDLWFENILFRAPDQVLVVDWHKAAKDDAARDYALLFTGSLELMPIDEATSAILELAGLAGVEARLPAYVALSTLHDLHWFRHKQPQGFATALELKLPRITRFLQLCDTSITA
jgi:Phosphotransferase enzyme family